MQITVFSSPKQRELLETPSPIMPAPVGEWPHPPPGSEGRGRPRSLGGSSVHPAFAVGVDVHQHGPFHQVVRNVREKETLCKGFY